MPDLFPLDVDDIQAYLLIFTRVSATLAFLPVLGGQGVPNQMKAGLAALISIILFPLVDTSKVTVDIDILTLGLMVVSEGMIGVMTAFIVNLIFAAVQLAGMMIDFQIGFGIVNVVDPITNASVSVSGQVLNITAILLFLAFNAHHLVLMGLANSFNIAPIGGLGPDLSFAQMMIDLWSAVYSTGMAIAAPVTITLLLKQTAMGLLARTVPQMNIFIVGFPITIVLGLITLGICLPTMGRLLEKLYLKLPEKMELIYHTFA